MKFGHSYIIATAKSYHSRITFYSLDIFNLYLVPCTLWNTDFLTVCRELLLFAKENDAVAHQIAQRSVK